MIRPPMLSSLIAKARDRRFRKRLADDDPHAVREMIRMECAAHGAGSKTVRIQAAFRFEYLGHRYKMGDTVEMDVSDLAGRPWVSEAWMRRFIVAARDAAV